MRECLTLLRWSQRGLADAVGGSEGVIRMMARGTRAIPPELATWLEALAAAHEAYPAPVLADGRSRAADLIARLVNDPCVIPAVKETLAGRILRQMVESSAEPRTADYIKSLAGRALEHPEMLSQAEISELGGSVLRHIERKEKVS